MPSINTSPTTSPLRMTSNRPKIVSRSTSAPPASPASLSAKTVAPSTTAATAATTTANTSTTSTSTSTITYMDEDELIAQATASAMLAAKLTKTKQPFLFSSVETNTENKLPLGDAEQRKLIEKKLGHALDKEPLVQHQHQQPVLKNVMMMKDVKEKFENLFPQASNKINNSTSSTTPGANNHNNHNNNSNAGNSGTSSSNNNNSNANANDAEGEQSLPLPAFLLSNKRKSRPSSPLEGDNQKQSLEKQGGTDNSNSNDNNSSNNNKNGKTDNTTTMASANSNISSPIRTRTKSPLPLVTSNNSNGSIFTAKPSSNNVKSTTINANATAKTKAKEKPTLSAIVWKRRNGYGKFSMNAWEKRRMDLVGTKVMYYKQKDTQKDTDGNKDKDKDKEQPQNSNNNDSNNESNNNSSNSNSSNTNNNINAAGSAITNVQPSSVTPSISIEESETIEVKPSSISPLSQTHATEPSTFTSDAHTVPPENNNNNNNSTDVPSTTPSSAITNISTTTKSQPSAKKDIHQFWEQTKQSFNKTINEISAININTINSSINNSSNNGAEDDLNSPNSPRGSIDLHKENVTVSALSDHEKSLTSVSPTPYGLCIATKGEDKWKVCFESHGEQIKWLTVLTEIIVRKSVNTYNQELVKSRGVTITAAAANIADSSNNDSVGIGISGVSSGVVTGGNASNSTGGIVNALNAGNSGIKIDIFRPAPEGKDGMWNMDEKFSSRNLLVIDEDSEYEDDASSSSAELVLKDEPTSSPSAVLEEEITQSKENEFLEIPIVSDLPPPVEKLILRGAATGPNWLLKGHNLSFVVGLLNVSILWIYISPIHWLLFPFFLAAVNILLILPIMGKVEEDCHDDGKPKQQKSLRMITASIKMLGRSMTSFHDDKLSKPEKATPIKRIEPEPANVEVKSTGQLAITMTAKKPIAGTTSKRLLDPTESHFVNDHEFVAWSTHPSEDVQVRSQGYAKTRKKVSASFSLYEVTNVDIFDSNMRVSEMATKVVLPKVTFDDEEDDSLEGGARWKSPDTFVVSLGIPSEEPSFTRSTDDGYGFTITIYYKMKKETREILKKITAPGYNYAVDSSENNLDVQKRVTNGVRLWEEWCKKAPTDADWQAKFKFIVNVLNPNEVGLPSWMAKYSGKPVLIKRKGVTGFLSTHPEMNAFEFDISLHPFPYLAKKAMAYLKSNVFKKSIASLAFVIEARSDDELPEILLGDAVQLHYPNPDIAIKADDFFAGTAPKSIKQD